MKDLKTVLNECKKYAKTGYKIASNNEKSLNRALSATEERYALHYWSLIVRPVIPQKPLLYWKGNYQT